jgi:hypothetical protein
MRPIDKIIDRLITESINEKAEEITNKIKNKISMNEDAESYDLEIGNEYEYKSSDNSEPQILIFKKRIPHGGKFKKKGTNHEIILTNKMIEKRIQTPNSKEMGAEMGEGLSKGQKYIAKQASPKNKIDANDFKALRNKKKEMSEDLGGMGDDMGPGEEFNVNLSNDKDPRVQALKRRLMRNYDDMTEPTMRGRFFDQEDQEDEWSNDEEKFENFGESVIYKVAITENNYVDLTEDELVNMIEELVTEEQKIKNNIKSIDSKGLTVFNKIYKQEASENSKAIKDIERKMSEYVKAGSKGNFEMNPKHFPKGNGELEKMDKKAYVPSEDVTEYIDAYAYPGMTNLNYDEIKPNDEWVEDNIKGSAKTGNSSEYANAVETEVGEKFVKNYKENPYGKQQKNASYKRQSQPVDIAGEYNPKNNSKSKSSGKAQKALDKLSESVKVESKNLINEEMETMKKLISYNQRTQ